MRGAEQPVLRVERGQATAEELAALAGALLAAARHRPAAPAAAPARVPGQWGTATRPPWAAPAPGG